MPGRVSAGGAEDRSVGRQGSGAEASQPPVVLAVTDG
ncbi:hypothetical protein RKD39_006541 [Streptomyces albogriseolus]